METIHEKQLDLQSVSTVFEHIGLRKIIQKAEFLLALDRHVQTLLPPSFAPHCQVMNLNEYTLVLGVTSAAIGTRIQFMSEALLKSLREEPRFAKILNIRCKVIAQVVKLS
jgi:hypothetical protein